MAAVTGTAAGHPNVRATHSKTLELAREAGVGPRATCVVGVAAAVDERALAALHGRVELVLEAGGESVAVRGRLNPAFRPGDPLVVRRAAAVTRDALVVDADTVAADVPRSFVAQLSDPATRISVRVTELPDEAAPGVLVVEPAAEPGALQVDPDMRGEHEADGPVEAASVTGALREGRRVTLRADLERPEARAAIAAAHEAGATVLPSPGLSVGDAVLAVAGIARAGCTQIDGRDSRPRDVDWDAVSSLLVTDARAERVPKWLRRAARARLDRGAMALDPGTPREQYLPWRAGEAIEARGARATLALAQPEDGRTAETISVSRPEPRTSR
jgi:hypothetical protein